MRAIILHAVRAKKFTHCKLEITKDLTLTVDEILRRVRNHFIAVKTNQDLIGATPNSKQVCFAKRVGREIEEERDHNEKHVSMPPLPKDLKSVVSSKVYFRLKRWWDCCSKKNKNSKEKDLLFGGKYTLFIDDSRPSKPGGNDDRNNDRNNNCYDGPADSNRNKRKRSSKDNRHSQRNFRRSQRMDSEESGSGGDTLVGRAASYYSSEDEEYERKKRKKRRHDSDRKNKVIRKRRRALVSPVGVLVPKGNAWKQRRVTKRGYLDISSGDDHIMIIDSACDQSMVHSSACMVLDYTSEYFRVEGAMSGMTANKPLQVVNAAVKVTNPYDKNDALICIINQALLVVDDNHVEALLQPHQARNFGTAIDECARHHVGVNGKRKSVH